MQTRLRAFAGALALVVALVPGRSAQAAGSGPAIDDASMYNGGHQCSTTTSPPLTVGYFAPQLEAAGSDPGATGHSFDYTFEIWPAADPAAVTDVHVNTTSTSRVAHATVPDGVLADAATYTWRVQVSDPDGTSDWSRSCVFRTDFTTPAAPDLTSPNFPLDQWGPAGKNVKFTVTPHDPDVVGYVYSWLIPLGVYGCDYSGPQGQLVCQDPLTEQDVVPASASGGPTQFSLDPPDDGPTRLTVEAFDAAGNFSAPVEYGLFFISPSGPGVTVDGGTACGATATLLLAPDSHVSHVVAYRYSTGGDDTDVTEVAAQPDGTASVTVPMQPDHFLRFVARSVSANGFVSTPNIDFVNPGSPPGVTSDVYVDSGSPVGGVGIEGTFTVSPPTNFGTVAEYHYRFGSRAEHTATADPMDDTAVVHWAPSRAGHHTLTVTAVAGQADGGTQSCPATYAFDVAGGPVSSSPTPSSTGPTTFPPTEPTTGRPTDSASASSTASGSRSAGSSTSEAPASTAAGVANTGSPVAGYVLLAGLLFAVGAALLLVGRAPRPARRRLHR